MLSIEIWNWQKGYGDIYNSRNLMLSIEFIKNNEEKELNLQQ